MSRQLFKKLEDYKKRGKLSVVALCRKIDLSNTVSYYRWKKARKITGPYKKIIEDFFEKEQGFSSKEFHPVTVDIAVIGIACYYPGASNIKELWENIITRRVQFRRMLDQRLPLGKYFDSDPKAPDKTYLTKAAFIENYQFDWGKLRIPKKTVESTDIAHWLALDIALKTFEDAGFKLSDIPLQNTGVIVGNTLTGEQTRSQTLRLRWPYVQDALNATLNHLGMGKEERGRIAGEMEQIYKSAFYPVTEDSLAGGLANTIAGRICNYLNLKGGGYIVDGACSSSLLAVATACDALTMRHTDLVLAGGVDISLDPFELVGFAKAGALAKDKMSVYDQSANGFLPGEGCGFILLKRLEDAIKDKNYVYATIKGWGISSDGKGGIMEPSSSGQSFAIGRAYKNLNYKIADVDFVEGHGTGTTKGDRVELEGIATAIEQTVSKANKNVRTCGVTSFKSIVGHTKAAAGIGGLIKAILAVNQRVLPPTASCITPNDVFKDKAKNLYPLIQGRILDPKKIARAGISSAGFGGINCHVTVESKDAPKEELKSKIDERALFVSQQQSEIFVFTSRTVIHLKKVIARFKEDLRNVSIAEMADLAALLNKKVKQHLPIKASIVTDTPEHLYDALVDLEKDIESLLLENGKIHKIKANDINTQITLSCYAKQARVGFLYPGQGSQRLNMTRVLVERYKWAQDLFELSKLPLYDHIYKPTDKYFTKEDQQEFEAKLADTRITQPAIVMSSLIWSEFLSKLGIKPVAVAGHSLGELTAFYKAGGFSKETLIRFAELRGQLMASHGRIAGAMVSLFCSRQKAEEYVSKISGNVILANINSPQQMIVSGGKKEIEKVIELAQQEEISTRRLNVSNAFHSSLMQPASVKIYSSKVLPDNFETNGIKVYSGMNASGLEGRVNVKEYFSKQVVSQVDFVGLVESISKECDFFIEVGPGRVLTDLVKSINYDQPPFCLPIESTAQNDKDLNIVLAELFVRNVPIKWDELYKNRLIKVFVPASKKKFIENQCERPLRLGNEILKSETLKISTPGSTVIEQPEEIIPGGLPAIEGKDNIADLLIDLTHKLTGFDKSSISLNLRLLDDLNLDSIKAAELIGQATRALGIAGQIDPSKISNNTLNQISDRLHELVDEQGKAGFAAKESTADILRRYQDKAWVRNFIQKLIPQEITTRNVNQLHSIKNVILLSDTKEDSLADGIKEHFKVKVKVRKVLYDEDIKVEKASFDCLIAVFPRDNQTIELNKDSLKSIIKRFNKIVALAHSNQMGKDAFVVCVQFGGGNFGENNGLKGIASASAKSLASTLYLEKPELKVRIIDFDNQTSDKEVFLKVIDELQTYEQFNVVGYDATLKRSVINYDILQPAEYKKRDISWSTKDVILVTGGAKGITAQCTLEFAKATKIKMVLVGRSPVPKKGEDNEINQTLKLFENENLKASYYKCDVTDEKNVVEVIKAIEQKEGKVTGFIHGAGLNSLKRLKQVNVTEALNESLPKVLGAVNVCKALSEPPKLIAAITSIIGVTGMDGSGWYGLANEVLNLFLHQYKAKNPKTEVVSVAYSVWDEVGMGAKLGSVKLLANKGIGAISVVEGVKRFCELIGNDPGTQQVIVAARLAGLDTWKSPAVKTNKFRFIEKIEYFLSGVELIAQAQLNVKDDPYLLDHNWKGSLLLPFVFGLEAMAQSSSLILGVEDIDNILATQIRLNKPITVAENSPTTIHIRAIKEENSSNVDVQIYCDLDNFTEPYFRADIQFNSHYSTSSKKLNLIGKERTDIIPKDDLYGKILFQGKMFQYLKDIYQAEYNDNKKEGYCTFSLVEAKHVEYLTGSPFVIDSVFQSMQLVFSDTLSLPQTIDSLFIKPKEILKNIESVTHVKQIESSHLEGENISGNNGDIVLSITNCRLKILEKKEEWPNISQIKNPVQRDSKIFNNYIKELSEIEGVSLPKIYFSYQENLPEKSKDERRQVVKEWLKDLGFKNKDEIKLTYSKDNKPIIDSPKDKMSHISIAHKNSYLFLSLGENIQGIDIEDIKERNIGEWQSILSTTAKSVFNQLLSIGVELNIAGTCAWTVSEILFKATNKQEDNVTYIGTHQEKYLFSSKLLGENSKIISGVIGLTRGRPKILSVIVSSSPNEDKDTSLQERIISDSLNNLGFKIKDLCGVGADFTGPQDQLVFKCHFPVTFKNILLFSKNLYFTSYFDFCGTLREYSIFPILKQFLETAKSGKTSMVTKMTSLDVYRPVQIGDILEGRLWMDSLKGSKNSTMNMFYEWNVINRGEAYKVADCRQDTIWIKIDEDGKAEIDEYPQYVKEYVDLMKPKTTRIKSSGLKNKSFESYSGKELDILGKHLPNKYKVFEKTITSTLEHSNLLSNIYFSSFAKWIGQLTDEYCHTHLPEFYKNYSGQKEIFCSNCTIDFYNEAFPFDKILIEMHINKVFENGVEFHFEFHKVEENKKVMKLASASQQILFVSINNNELLALKVPDQFIKTVSKLRI